MQNTKIKQFTIRAYALVINHKNEILLSDEFAMNMNLTKFPGGGVEFGEGTRDALMREFVEEFGQECEVLEHFYTTDFFQQAFTREDLQLVSIYYFARFKEELKFKISDKPFDLPDFKAGDQTFRFVPLKDLTTDSVTLPIDKIVVEMLIKKNIQ